VARVVVVLVRVSLFVFLVSASSPMSGGAQLLSKSACAGCCGILAPSLASGTAHTLLGVSDARSHAHSARAAARPGRRAEYPRLDDPNQVGVHAVGQITRQAAERKRRWTLPHEEGNHAGAGRGGRGGWCTPHKRGHLVPWAQEPKRIGVPAPHHGEGPGGGEACDQRDVAVEVCDVEKPQPQR
jgi:hypothetical protein